MLTSTSDVKELIPEFYSPDEDGSFLTNSMNLQLGTRQNGTPCGDVALPAWADSPAQFIATNRAALESAHVSAHLHLWIDLIFGCKQRGPAAERADNVFHYLTYEGGANMPGLEGQSKAAIEQQISEFGQTPVQLFNTPHPPRAASSDEQSYCSFRTPPKPTIAKVLTPSPLIVRKKAVEPPKEHSDYFNDSRPPPEWPQLTRKADVRAMREPVVALAVSGDGRCVAVVGAKGTMSVYSFHQRSRLHTTTLGTLSLSAVCWTNDSVLAGASDGKLYEYSLSNQETVNVVAAHAEQVLELCELSQGVVLSAAADGLKLWRASGSRTVFSREPLWKSPQEPEPSVATVVANAADLAAVGTEQAECAVWCSSQDRLELQVRFAAHPVEQGRLVALAVGPDRVASCAASGEVRLHSWKPEEVNLLQQIEQSAVVHQLALNSDTVLAACDDGFVRIWGAETEGHAVRVEHGEAVTALALHSDGEGLGSALSTSTSFGTVQRWAVETSECQQGSDMDASECAPTDSA